jgi:hypothetical protein
MRLVHLMSLLSVVLFAAVGNAAELSPVGEWRWFNKVTVTIKADGTVTENKGHRGIWKWTDSESGEFKIIWERRRSSTFRINLDAVQCS